MQMWSLTSMDFTGITVEISHLPARGQLHAACACFRVLLVSESGCVTTYIILCVHIFSGCLALGLYIITNVTVICHIRFLFE